MKLGRKLENYLGASGARWGLLGPVDGSGFGLGHHHRLLGNLIGIKAMEHMSLD